MNANELADALWFLPSTDRHLIEEAATMLRQQQAEIKQWGVEFDKLTDDFMKQQAEIEALKAEKIRAYDNGYEDGRKPNTNKAQE